MNNKMKFKLGNLQNDNISWRSLNVCLKLNIKYWLSALSFTTSTPSGTFKYIFNYLNTLSK